MICDFLTEFEKWYNKTKSHGTIWSDDLLAYWLLKSANLTTRDEQLVKATIGKLKYDAVKIKLTKIFSDTNEVPTADLNKPNIKSEPTYHTQNLSAEQISADNPDYEEQFDHSNQEFLQETSYDSDYCDTYFNRNKENKYNRKSKTYPNTNPRQLQCALIQQSPQNHNWRTHKQENRKYGNSTKCAICHSINHWAQNCPDRESKNTYVVNEVVFHQSDYDNPNKLKHLTSETWSSALLDCGAS